MTDKQQYRLLCQTEESIPIYSRDWWLDIVCGTNNWNVLLATKKNGEIISAFPYFEPCQGVITMPFYTQTMGPWFSPANSKETYRKKVTQRQDILKLFISELNKTDFFHQNFNYEITDWLPFYWDGYKQTTRYTYILNNIKEHESVWLQMSSNIRRNITKAQDKNKITVKKNIPIEDFLKVQSLTFKRQNLNSPKGENVLIKLIKESRKRKQGDIWGGYDEQGNLHAAAFIVWQQSSAYYIAGGGNPKLRDSGAHALILWTAIKELSAITDRFDFEGSMIPGVERFFREFGAKQYPFFTINKGNLSLLNRIKIKLSYLIKNFSKANARNN